MQGYAATTVVIAAWQAPAHLGSAIDAETASSYAAEMASSWQNQAGLHGFYNFKPLAMNKHAK